jgi:hypothetical protein
VLTTSGPIQLGDALEKSGLIGDLWRTLETRRSLSVSRILSAPDLSSPLNPSPLPFSAPEAPSRQKVRRGGWRSTKCLSPEWRARAVHGAIELRRQGFPLNVMVTYRPPDGFSDANGKRWIDLQHARIGQALERAGHAFIGLKVFEKRPGARLHAHALYHVARRCLGVIENAVDVFERKAKHGQKGDVPIHGRPATADDVEYVTKQRRWAGPDIERNRPSRLLYQQGDSIVGARLSFTKYAAAKIWPKPRVVAEPSARPLLRLVINALIAEPKQLGLFSEKPVSRLAQFAHGIMPGAVAQEVEARRKWRGLTQGELAVQIGVSRPQLVNALRGRFGLSEWATARLREFLLGPVTPSFPRAA